MAIDPVGPGPGTSRPPHTFSDVSASAPTAPLATAAAPAVAADAAPADGTRASRVARALPLLLAALLAVAAFGTVGQRRVRRPGHLRQHPGRHRPRRGLREARRHRPDDRPLDARPGLAPRVGAADDPGRRGQDRGMTAPSSDPPFDPHALLAGSRLGVLATIKTDGRPQLSPVHAVLRPRGRHAHRVDDRGTRQDREPAPRPPRRRWRSRAPTAGRGPPPRAR